LKPLGKRRFKTAFILGAGLGMRLRPLTDMCPKPLLPVNGRPIVAYVMDHLLTVGVDRFIINTHHCPNIYKETFPDSRWGNVPIIFRHEVELLDTGGGLKNIEDLLTEDEAIICYNGDVIADFPLERLLKGHEEKKGEVTLALRSNTAPLNVSLDKDGYICDLRHTLGISGIGDYLFTGIYTVETSFLRYLQKGEKTSIVISLLRRIRQTRRSIAGVVIDEGCWFDTGTIDEYKRLNGLANRLCLTRKG